MAIDLGIAWSGAAAAADEFNQRFSGWIPRTNASHNACLYVLLVDRVLGEKSSQLEPRLVSNDPLRPAPPPPVWILLALPISD